MLSQKRSSEVGLVWSVTDGKDNLNICFSNGLSRGCSCRKGGDYCSQNGQEVLSRKT